MGAPVRLAVERHQVDDPGERQHTASADCWCEPVVEVVHRRRDLGIDAAAMCTEQQGGRRTLREAGSL